MDVDVLGVFTVVKRKPFSLKSCGPGVFDDIISYIHRSLLFCISTPSIPMTIARLLPPFSSDSPSTDTTGVEGGDKT